MEAETTLSYTNVGAASVEDNKVQVEQETKSANKTRVEQKVNHVIQ